MYGHTEKHTHTHPLNCKRTGHCNLNRKLKTQKRTRIRRLLVRLLIIRRIGFTRLLVVIFVGADLGGGLLLAMATVAVGATTAACAVAAGIGGVHLLQTHGVWW